VYSGFYFANIYQSVDVSCFIKIIIVN